MAADKIVLFDSPEAARPYTCEGWLSRNGFFFKDEHSARYDGCTHRPCTKCGEPARKSYTLCDRCRDKAATERYEKRPKDVWDGKGMLYSEVTGEYFMSPDDASESESVEGGLAAMRLVICEPNYVRELDSDYVCDLLGDDEDTPADVMTAMEAFNEAVKGIILSWSPGPYALDLESGGNPL
jgi:hypothetical protein